MSFFFSWRQSYGLEQLKMNPACLLRDSPYMNYSMAAPTLLPTGLLPRYSSVATTPVTTYQVSSNPAWMPQYIMQPGMPHVSTFTLLTSLLLITSLVVTMGMNEMLQANFLFLNFGQKSVHGTLSSYLFGACCTGISDHLSCPWGFTVSCWFVS